MRKKMAARVRVGWRKFKIVLCHKLHDLCHKTEHFLHGTYLGAVSYEAHGMYRWCALALLVVIVIAAVTGGVAAAGAVAETTEEL